MEKKGGWGVDTILKGETRFDRWGHVNFFFHLLRPSFRKCFLPFLPDFAPATQIVCTLSNLSDHQNMP